MKEKFISFLKENNALESFAQNALNDHHALVDDIMSRHAPEHWLAAAFDWQASPQTHDYWARLNKKWLELLKEN